MNPKSPLIAILSQGSICSIGTNEDAIWKAYLDEQSYLSKSDFWKASLNSESELLIKEFLENQPKYKKLDRSVILSIIASENALKKAKLSTNKIGINIGSSRGATISFEEQFSFFQKEDKAQLLSSPLTTLGNISSNVARHLNLFGPLISHSITCSTALQAVANASAWLSSGMSDYFLVGGSETPLTTFTAEQMQALGIYSQLDDSFACQPLGTKDVNSMVLGEGAASFLLSRYEGQEVEAVIEGIGYGFESSSSLTGISENGQALQDAMKMALDQCTSKEPVDLILMHAPGTKKGDKSELNAIKNCFKDIPNLYSNKYKIGHTLGASGALSISLAIQCIKNETTPPIHYDNAISNDNRPIRKVMVNALGFGGNASSVVISSSNLF